jgi:hypothetical protein
MEPARGLPLAVVGLVVVVLAVTGPFGPLSVPTEYAGDQAPGTGNATITVTDPPDQPRFEPGRQGEGIYYLRVPDAEIEVRNLRGNPTLVYTVGIEELGYSRSSVHFLGAAGPGRHAISMDQDTFEGGRLDRDTYNASLELVLRTEGTARELYRTGTTVVVD